MGATEDGGLLVFVGEPGIDTIPMPNARKIRTVASRSVCSGLALVLAIAPIAASSNEPHVDFPGHDWRSISPQEAGCGPRRSSKKLSSI